MRQTPLTCQVLFLLKVPLWEPYQDVLQSRAPSRSRDDRFPPPPHLTSFSASANLKLLLSGTSLSLTLPPSTSSSQLPFPASWLGHEMPISKSPLLQVRAQVSANKLDASCVGAMIPAPLQLPSCSREAKLPGYKTRRVMPTDKASS